MGTCSQCAPSPGYGNDCLNAKRTFSVFKKIQLYIDSYGKLYDESNYNTIDISQNNYNKCILIMNVLLKKKRNENTFKRTILQF